MASAWSGALVVVATCCAEGEKTDDDAANDGSGAALDESPLLAAGELLLFDYRCLHRGRANLTRDPRPIAYVLFARPGVVDRHNFPEESVYDASPAGTIVVS